MSSHFKKKYYINMKINKIFSKNLIKYRKLKGLSQQELAKLSGMSQRMITYYENNPNSIPVEKLNTLAKVLNINISDFFDEKENIEIDNLDVRWTKKLQELKKLSESEQKEIIKHINYLIDKNISKEKNLVDSKK